MGLTDKTISYSLRNCDEAKGVVVRVEGDLQAILLKKRIREPSCSQVKVRECLILKLKDQKIGMIVHFPYSDVQLYVFQKYRNKGYMSSLIKDGFLKQLWPDITSCRIVNHEEYDRVKHLLNIAGYSVRKESKEEHDAYLDQMNYLNHMGWRL